MKSFKFLPLFLTLCLILSSLLAPTAAAVAEPSVSVPSALVLDRNSGSVIFAKNADQRVHPASTTKVMTVLLAVEAVEAGTVTLDDPVTASASSMQGMIAAGSTAGITPGETLTLEELMYCAMVSSANEACNIIAEHVSGSIADFVALMNQRAAELGCSATHFANTHGLTDSKHYTTAADFSLISLEALRHPLFTQICSAAEKEIPASNKSAARSLKNSNALICSKSIYGSSYLYDGAQGVKTGHTSAAGYCLVSAASRGGVELLTLVFGATSSDNCFRDTIRLYDWTFNNYSYREILSSRDSVGTVSVLTDGELDYVDLCPAEDFVLLLPNDYDLSDFSQEVTIYANDSAQPLVGPIEPGTALGKIQLLKNGETFGSIDLVPVSASALVINSKTGDILLSKGADNRVYPADTTKLMTALLAVEAVEKGLVSMNDLITASEVMEIDLSDASTRSGIRVGENLTLESLLYYAMLISADDVCNLIAEYVAGSVPEFVARMNQRAEELGCTSTNFTNVHGAFNSEHYTTARDFSLIATELMRHDQLMHIVDTVITELDETNFSPARTLKNTNALICDESVYGANYLYEGASGMKTGYNAEAGYALISTASRNDIDLLCLVFGGQRSETGFSQFEDTIAAYDLIFNNYSYQEILKSTENIASVDIALGSDANYVNLRPSDSVTVLLPNDFDLSDFETNIRVYALEDGETLTAPIAAGQVLGEITLSRDGRDYSTVKLVASSSVELSRLQYIKSQLQETTQQKNFRITVLCLALFFLLYLVWVICYRIKRLKYLHAVRTAEKLKKQQDAKLAPQSVPTQDNTVAFFRPDGDCEEAEHTAIVQKVPSVKSESAPAAPVQADAIDEDNLLRQAVCVAELETPAPAVIVETPEEKAERDYFEEFFRQK